MEDRRERVMEDRRRERDEGQKMRNDQTCFNLPKTDNATLFSKTIN